MLVSERALLYSLGVRKMRDGDFAMSSLTAGAP